MSSSWVGSFISHAKEAVRIGQQTGENRPVATLSHSDASFSGEAQGTSSIMGKSNKFDYTNRGSSGERLGLIMGDALRKEAVKAIKDAERTLKKVKKSDEVSPKKHCDGKHDGIVHALDIRAPGKALGDEGFLFMAQGLEEALRCGTLDANLAVEDLDLQDNYLTTRSLARLAPIIELTRHDLKTLNLAGNKIKVETDMENYQWEIFLHAFGGCLKLRRLDLSRNVELGARAMETFVKVHSSEPHIDPAASGDEQSVQSLFEQLEMKELPNDRLPAMDSPMDPDSECEDGLASGRMIKRRCGLRSIPYLTLRHISLNDATALWLSYLLEDHYYPNHPLNNFNATTVDNAVPPHQQEVSSRGIDCDMNNDRLGKDGMHLLIKTEAIRRQMLLENQNIVTSSNAGNTSDNAVEQGATASSRFMRAEQGSRRSSARSTYSVESAEYDTSEVESTRKKIQRHIIEYDGVQSVDLWRVALRTLQTSRAIRVLIPAHLVRKKEALMSFQAVNTGNLSVDASALQPSRMTYSAILCKPDGIPSDKSKTLTSLDGLQPMNSLMDVTNHPWSSPHVGHHVSTDDGCDAPELCAGESADNSWTSYNTSRESITSKHHAYIEWQHARTFHYRGTTAVLPLEIFERILQFVTVGRQPVDSSDMATTIGNTLYEGVLSNGQLRAAYAWGQDRRTLAKEREWMWMAESAQVWCLLDGIGCLRYNT